MNTERVKSFLHGYQNSLKRIEMLNMRINELRFLAMGTGIQYSDMPKAHNITDLSNYAAKLDELERTWNKERMESLEQLEKITNTIKRIDNQTLAQVLEMRYIFGLRWEDIAEKTGYTVRNVLLMHGKGLSAVDELMEV